MRDALAYYTEMQRALEEEKARKDSLQETGDSAGQGEKNGLISEIVTSGPNSNMSAGHSDGGARDENSPQHQLPSTSPSSISSSPVMAPTDSLGKPRHLGSQGLMKAGSLRRSSTTQLSSTKQSHDVKASSPS